MSEVGRQKDLPCPSAKILESGNFTDNVKMTANLIVHTRILAGTKILSFSDSSWLSEQVELGLLRKGGDFKSAICEINVDGFGLYLMDDFPRELMGVVVRDIQIHKPMGSIEATVRIRHFQVDAMLPNARYPIIIQPLPLGVDRREPVIQNSALSTLISSGSVNKSDCYWMKHDEKPIPVFEITCSYVPQVSRFIWLFL